ncbi:MAG: OmpH family outer membrane protein [Nitrospirae bacterium]|nr:OmpH family outer membrane protein [Nitrospirota bacterium]
MKKIFAITIIVLGISAFAVQGAEVKIGYVDLNRTLNGSVRGVEAKKTLNDMVMAKQTVIDKMKSDAEKLEDEIEKQASVLTPEGKKEKEEQRDKLRRDTQRIFSDFQEEIKKKEMELMQVIIKDLREIVNKIGEEEGYAAIFEISDGNVVYWSKKLDITDKVIKKYNESTSTTTKTKK